MPSNFDEFNFEDHLFQHLNNTIDPIPQKFLQYDNRSKNNRIQTFVSEVGLKYLSESEPWQSDGTLKSVPKPFKQSYLILAGKSSEKVLPCAFILIQKKSFAAYKEMFKLIAEGYTFNLAPKFGKTDFEHSVLKALKHCFHQNKMCGCYFHFKQAVEWWIFQHSYKSSYEQNEQFRKQVKNLNAAAVVPIDSQFEALQILKKETALLDIDVNSIVK